MKQNNLLNYAIWATVIGGSLYFLYKNYGKGGIGLKKTQRKWTLEEVKDRYPNWKLQTSKSTGNPYYSKSFWTLNQDGSKFKEMWFIFYHNNTWKIYTREVPEKFVSGGNYTSPTNLEVTDGYNKGKTFKTNSLIKSVSRILKQEVSELPNE